MCALPRREPPGSPPTPAPEGGRALGPDQAEEADAAELAQAAHVRLAQEVTSRQLDDLVDDAAHGQRVRRLAVGDAQHLDVLGLDARRDGAAEGEDAPSVRRGAAG